MSLREMLGRLRSAVRKRAIEQELDTELQFHLDMQADELVRQGLSPEEARQRARRELGAVTQIREDYRERAGLPMLEHVYADIRYGIRKLVRDRAFAAVAVLTFACGIAASTSIFSLVNALLLKPLPYTEPQQLYVIQESIPQAERAPFGANIQHYLKWKEGAPAFESIGAASFGEVAFSHGGDAEQIGFARATATLFPTLGIQPQIGRLFTAENETSGNDAVVLLTDGLWRRRFGADPGVLGTMVRVDGVPHTVIGVLPASGELPRGDRMGAVMSITAELIKPFALLPYEKNPYGNFNHGVIGRLRDGASVDEAVAQLDAICTQIAATAPFKAEYRAHMDALHEKVVGSFHGALWAVFAAVLALLFIGCLNLANLLLVRATTGRKETAVRSALGASRTRIVQQWLAETTVLAITGGALGIALTYAAVALLVRTLPADLPRVAEVRVDATVLIFALATTLLTALLFAIVPSLRASTVEPGEALKAGERTTSAGQGQQRARKMLVSLQIGSAFVLLLLAALFLSSFARLVRVNLGFRVDHVLFADLGLRSRAYKDDAQRIRLFEQILEQSRAIPGVKSVGLTNRPPLEGEAQVEPITIPGDIRPVMERPSANVRFVSARFFESLGLAIRRGRGFTEQDRGKKVAVISEDAARTFWPGEDPLGKRVGRGATEFVEYEVVGVADNVRHALEKPGVLLVYVPFWGDAPSAMTLVVRSETDPASLVTSVRNVIHGADREVPLANVRTAEEVVDTNLSQRRFFLVLMAAFAIAAVLLAALGVYGVVSFAVTARRKELGIRMALGAQVRELRAMVVRQGLRCVAWGVIGGVAVALTFARMLRNLVFEVSPSDPIVYVIVLLAVGCIAVVASYVPAWRGTRLNPVEVLRAE